MKKKWFISFVIVMTVMVGALFFCGSSKTCAETIVMGTNEPGSLFYSMGIPIAELIKKNTSFTIETVTQGTIAWFPMLYTKEVDFGLDMSDAAWGGYKGLYVFKEPTKGKGYDMRTLLIGGPTTVAMTVADDSPVRTLKDLKGKRVITEIGILYSATMSTQALLANAGLSMNDVIQVSVTSLAEAADRMIEGKADGLTHALGSAQHKKCQAAGKARVVPVDPSPEALKRMHEVFSGYNAVKAPPTLTGAKEPMWVEGKDIIMIARTGLSDDVAYGIVKAMWENCKDLAPAHPGFKVWKPENFASTHAAIPYHPGAIKWYKEKGVWTEEMEKLQANLLK